MTRFTRPTGALRHPALCLLLAAGGLFAATPAAAQPAFSKAFSPDVIGPGSASRLTFTIDNSGMGSPASDLAFIDTLPADVTLVQPPSASNLCGGVLTAAGGGSTVELSGGSVGPGDSCTIAVDVTSSTVGTHSNVSGDLGSSAGNSGPAIADLTVDGGRPGFTKSFSADPIQLGETVTLTFSLDNSTSASSRFNLSFSDTLPAGLVIAVPSNAGGTCPAVGSSLTAVPGANTINYLALGPLAAGATCTVTVDVTAVTPGQQVNRSQNLTSTPAGPLQPSGFAVDSVDVNVDPLTLVKSFIENPAAPSETVTLRFTVHNFTRDPASGIGFSDDLDATLTGLAATGLPQNDICGPGSQFSGSSTLTLTGGSLADGASCSFDVTLQVPATATPGIYPNTTSTVTGSIDGAPTVGAPATDALVIAAAPILAKSIAPDPAVPGDELTVEFVLENPSADTITGISFSDDFASFIPGSTVTPPAASYCSGTGSSVSNLTQITFSGIDLASGASCTFSFALQVPLGIGSGTYTNTTSEVTATGSGAQTLTGRPATAEVDIVAAPRLEKAFVGGPTSAGDTVTLEFTLTTTEGTPATTTDIAFSDDLLAVLPGLVAIDTPLADVCGAGSEIAGTSTLSFTGGSLAPNSSCSFSVTLQVPAGAASGPYPNTTSAVTAMVSGVLVESAAASANLDIVGLQATKEFIDDPAVAGGTVALEFEIRNDDTSFAATGINFTDDLNAVVAGLAFNAGPVVNVCGAGSQLAGTTLLTLTGGSLAPGDLCTFTLQLDVPAGATAGEFINTTSQVSAIVDGMPLSLAPMVDGLVIVEPLTLAKTFIDDPVVAGGTVTLEFTIGNAHPTEAATGVSFIDDLDAALSGLQAVGTPIAACGGTLSGTSLLFFSGGSVAAADFCTFSVTLQVPATAPSGTAATNITSVVSGTIDGVGVSGNPAIDELLVEVAGLDKSFDGPTTATGTAVLSFTVDNFSSAGLSALSFTDDLSAMLAGATALGLPLTDVCGAGSMISGTSLLSFSDGSLAAGDSCSFDVTVQVPAAAAPGSYVNSTSDLTSGGFVLAPAASANLQIEPPPSFSKNFSPTTVGIGVPSTLEFAIDNSVSALTASGLDFTDTLPTGLLVATPANAATTCTGGVITAVGGSGSTAYSGGTVAAAASCMVTVDVVAAAAGIYVNTSGDLTSSSGVSGTANATLTVLSAPAVTKAFLPDSIAAGGSSTVIVTIDNAANPLTAAGLSFTDTLEGGIVVATPANAATTCTGGTLTAVASAGSFGYSGGSVAGGASCTVQVDVTAPTAGAVDNTVTLSSSLGTSAPASDVLEVSSAPLVAKSFSPGLIATGSSTTVTISIDNSANPLAATGLAFTDTLQGGIVVATPANASTTCTGGALTAVAGAGSFGYNGGAVADGASCTVQVDVTAPEAGAFENTVTVSSSLGTSAPASDTLDVSSAPLVDKAFSPDEIAVDGSTTVTITIDNSANAQAATGLSFTDMLQGGLLVADPANASTTCAGGTIGAVAGTGEFSYGGGMVAAGATCTVLVDVTAPAAGTFGNTVTVESSLGSSVPATDTLEVAGAPLVDKAFSPATIEPAGLTTVAITIDNTANPLPANGLSFTDNLQGGLLVADPANASTTCTTGTLTALAGASSFDYSGGSVAGRASCSVRVDVVGALPGTVENVVVVESSLGQSAAATAAVQVNAPAVVVPLSNIWGLAVLTMLAGLAGVARLSTRPHG